MSHYGNAFVHKYIADSTNVLDLIGIVDNEMRANSELTAMQHLAERSADVIAEIGKAINRGLIDILANSASVPARLTFSDLCIFSSHNVQINVGLFTKAITDNPCLFSLPSNAIFMNVGSSRLRFIPHKIPAECNLDEFDSNLSLIRGEPVDFCTGCSVHVDAKRVVPEFIVEDDCLVLKLLFRSRNQQGWVYDRISHKPLFSNSTDSDANRLQVAARLLALSADKFGPDKKSIDILEKMSENDAHFVRWTATQSLYRLAPERGADLLRSAMSDAHPHVRTAAASSWKRLYSDANIAT